MEAYEKLEQEFSSWSKSPNTVACATGTDALYLALRSLRLPNGSEILIPEFTMIACARAATMAGLTPVFVDCRDDNLLINTDHLNRYITQETRAIMPVHVYGRVADMYTINKIAQRRSLYVVEDCAEAHGADLGPMKSTARCWSFYKNKIVAGEEGGMVSFDNKDTSNTARKLRNLGCDGMHTGTYAPYGVSCRLSNAHASLILDSLEIAGENISRRRQIVDWYDELLPTTWHQPSREVCWVYDLRIPGMLRAAQEQIVRQLNDQDIPARLAFRVMSSQPEYYDWRHSSLKVHQASQEVLYLPIDPNMGRTDVAAITTALSLVVDDVLPAAKSTTQIPSIQTT